MWWSATRSMEWSRLGDDVDITNVAQINDLDHPQVVIRFYSGGKI